RLHAGDVLDGDEARRSLAQAVVVEHGRDVAASTGACDREGPSRRGLVERLARAGKERNLRESARVELALRLDQLLAELERHGAAARAPRCQVESAEIIEPEEDRVVLFPAD